MNRDLTGPLSTFVDPTGELKAQKVISDHLDQFSPASSTFIDFGYTSDHIWISLPVKNTDPVHKDWVVYFHENFKQVFEVFLLRDNGRLDTLMSINPRSTFSDRPLHDPELAAPFILAEGEKARILVHLWSQGSSALEMSFWNKPAYDLSAARRAAKNFAFYGMMILLIVIATAALALFRKEVFLAYVAYSIGALFFIMHADGVSFQFLFPNWPELNSYGSILAGASIIIFAPNYARVFLNTRKYHPIIHKFLLALIAIGVGMVVASLFFDNQPIKKLMVLFGLLSISMSFVAGLAAGRKRFKQVRFYILAWGSVVVSAVLMNLRHWLGIEISQDFQYDSMRAVMVFDAAMMGLAIADQYLQLRESRQEALSDKLAAANLNLTLSSRLNELENQFQQLNEAVRTKDERIRHTIHDLSQPINALRLNVKGLLEGGENASVNAEDISATFGYLEALISGYMSHSDDIQETTLSSNKGLRTVLERVSSMFADDAVEKNLEFSVQATDANVAIGPLPLMRIIANLVSNAIRHTKAGRVIVTSRDEGRYAVVEVTDTGKGLSIRQFDAVKDGLGVEQGNGNESTRHGYGLAIAHELAQTHNCTFYLDTSYKEGTKLVLQIPVS